VKAKTPFQGETNAGPFRLGFLLRKYHGNKEQLLKELIELIQERISSSRNMALFINAKSKY